LAQARPLNVSDEDWERWHGFRAVVAVSKEDAVAQAKATYESHGIKLEG
jgi:hypothetical protein